MSYFDALPSNEDDLEEDKTPYGSVSTRPPISDPRGRNPAMEGDQNSTPNILQGDVGLGSYSHSTIADAGHPSHHFSFMDDFGTPARPMPLATQLPISGKVQAAIQARMNPGNRNAITRMKNQVAVDGIRDSMGDDSGTGMGGGMAGGPAGPDLQQGDPLGGLNPGNQSAIDRIKNDLGDERSTPGQMGGSIDPALLDQPPMAPDVPPAPPIESPTPPAPKIEDEEPKGPSPASAMDDSGYSGDGNQFGNYYLAGVQGSHGGTTPRGENVLGLELNKQNNQNMNRVQALNINRSKIAQAIQNRIAAQAFQASQNDLNRANSKDIANIRANRPLLPGRPLDPGRQANFDANLALQKQKLGNTQEQQANNDSNSHTSNYVTMLDNSNKAQHILDNVKAGALTTSSNVASSLANDISSLLNNGKATAVSDREHAQIASLEGTWNAIKSYAQSKPTDTIPQAYLDQLEQELNILKGSTIQAYRNKVDELKSGTQNSKKQDVFQNRFDSQMKNNQVPNQNSNVRIKNPATGEIHSVPVDQKDAAIAAGGILQ